MFALSLKNKICKNLDNRPTIAPVLTFVFRYDVFLCPRPHPTWRQKDFLSLGAMKLLKKAERDGGIPELLSSLETLVFSKDICC